MKVAINSLEKLLIQLAMTKDIDTSPYLMPYIFSFRKVLPEYIVKSENLDLITSAQGVISLMTSFASMRYEISIIGFDVLVKAFNV